MVVAQFPEFVDQPVRFLGKGFDNVAVQIGQAVFRFPRGPVGAEFMDREIRWLSQVSNLVSLPISAPLWVGEPTDTYPCRFSGYPYIAGQTGCGLEWTPEQRARLVVPLAQVLRELHAAPVPENPPSDTMGRADLPRRAEAMREHVSAVVAAAPEVDAAQLERRVDAWCQAAQETPNCWVHGDLYARHLLVQPDGRLSGLIDWGDVHVGDPSVDLSVVPAMLNTEDRALFFEHYGDIAPSTWDRARFVALFSGMILIEYGQAIGDRALFDAGRHNLQVLLREPLSSGTELVNGTLHTGGGDPERGPTSVNGAPRIGNAKPPRPSSQSTPVPSTPVPESHPAPQPEQRPCRLRAHS